MSPSDRLFHDKDNEAKEGMAVRTQLETSGGQWRNHRDRRGKGAATRSTTTIYPSKSTGTDATRARTVKKNWGGRRKGTDDIESGDREAPHKYRHHGRQY